MLLLGNSLSLSLHLNLIHLSSEVFVIVSLTLSLPVCLEQLARDNGYLLLDKTAYRGTLPLQRLLTN